MASLGGKRCAIPECTKSARGQTDFCVRHGGGKRCQSEGCGKSAQGSTDFCMAHGGGKRCSWGQPESEFGEGEGPCYLFARGKTGLCTLHDVAQVQYEQVHGSATLGPMRVGGGRRCSQEGCGHAARGPTGLCIRHGGGTRCQKENCTKSAEGLSGLCVSHGGSRRCRHLGCSRGAQGSTMFCKAHGGGKPEEIKKEVVVAEEGTNVDVLQTGPLNFNWKQWRRSPDRHPVGGNGGPSGTLALFPEASTGLCKAHGGGERCSWGRPESDFGRGEGPCNLLTRGNMGLCLLHGYQVPDKQVRGGAILGPSMVQVPKTSTMFCEARGVRKRCQSEGRGESEEGGNGFCEAHAGVKRCSWGQRESVIGQGEGPCCSFAWERTGLCTLHGALSIGAVVQDKWVHGGAKLRFMVHGS